MPKLSLIAQFTRHGMCALLACGAAMAQAAPLCSAQSGAKTTVLLELFTSEGCDSCPPADKWFSSIKSSSAVIALSWHVDYWDRLGWKDRFAHPYATERQRAIAALGNSRNIYTPQSAAQSRSIYFTESADMKARIEQTIAQNSPAGVAIKAHYVDNKSVAVNLRITALENNAVGYVALVEDGLVSNVSAGENRGATLKHDHVVRQFAGPFKAAADGSVNQAVTLAVPQDSNGARLSVVAWAETARGQALQSVKLDSLAGCTLAAK